MHLAFCAVPSTWLAGRCTLPRLAAVSELAGGITGRACVVSPTARRGLGAGLPGAPKAEHATPPAPSFPATIPSCTCGLARFDSKRTHQMGGRKVHQSGGETPEKKPTRPTISSLRQRSRLARATGQIPPLVASPQTKRREGVRVKRHPKSGGSICESSRSKTRALRQCLRWPTFLQKSLPVRGPSKRPRTDPEKTQKTARKLQPDPPPGLRPGNHRPGNPSNTPQRPPATPSTPSAADGGAARAVLDGTRAARRVQPTIGPPAPCMMYLPGS